VAAFEASPGTFLVEEIPAYLPVGEGEHTFLWVEKNDLTTAEAVRRLARALGAQERDVGYAGQKDRHATTRQWLSVPRVAPEAAMAAAVEGVKVLLASRHGNKLRLGHLRGNRFEVVLERVAPEEAVAIEEALRGFARTGLPNRFGEQRFGASGDNVATALAILRGERRERDGRRRQFLLSALQSAVFNRALELREAGGGLLRVRRGDVLQKRVSGGLFVCEDPAVDQPRVEAGEVVPTGPLPGNRERDPPDGSEARALEDEALAAVGVARAELEALGRALPGARRPVVVALELGEPPTQAEGTDRLRLRFTLPAGSYATVVLAAIAARGLAEGKPVLTLPARAPS
jgi:tRNA pseudouridine13 synthase